MHSAIAVGFLGMFKIRSYPGMFREQLWIVRLYDRCIALHLLELVIVVVVVVVVIVVVVVEREKRTVSELPDKGMMRTPWGN
jgi:hypothetical protein